MYCCGRDYIRFALATITGPMAVAGKAAPKGLGSMQMLSW